MSGKENVSYYIDPPKGEVPDGGQPDNLQNYIRPLDNPGVPPRDEGAYVVEPPEVVRRQNIDSVVFVGLDQVVVNVVKWVNVDGVVYKRDHPVRLTAEQVSELTGLLAGFGIEDDRVRPEDGV